MKAIINLCKDRIRLCKRVRSVNVPGAACDDQIDARNQKMRHMIVGSSIRHVIECSIRHMCCAKDCSNVCAKTIIYIP